MVYWTSRLIRRINAVARAQRTEDWPTRFRCALCGAGASIQIQGRAYCAAHHEQAWAALDALVAPAVPKGSIDGE